MSLRGLVLLLLVAPGCVWMRTPVAEAALCPWDQQNQAFEEVVCPAGNTSREAWTQDTWGCHQAAQLRSYMSAIGLTCP